MKKNEETQETFCLEDGFERLNELIAKLESEQTPLEEAFALYEEGMKLSFKCQAQIDTVEKKLRILSEQEGAVDEE